MVAIMSLMVPLFDQGQHAQLCMKLRHVRQMKNESMVKFRTRYMEIVVTLHAYGWHFTDEQIIADVLTRVRDWATIATHRPTNINDVVVAAGSLEGSGVGPAANVATTSQILILNGVDVSVEGSSVMATGSGSWRGRDGGRGGNAGRGTGETAKYPTLYLASTATGRTTRVNARSPENATGVVKRAIFAVSARTIQKTSSRRFSTVSHK